MYRNVDVNRRCIILSKEYPTRIAMGPDITHPALCVGTVNILNRI